MTAHRARAVVRNDGTLLLEGLPLHRGEEVEVIVLYEQPTGEHRPMQEVRARLRGSVLKYEDPFGPAAPPEEWEANR